MSTIKLKHITFGDPPFRKLGGMTIEFADRVTIICGHNGIGKSTIMGLVANSCGLSTSKKHKSLFGRAYQGNLFEITWIDYEQEYAAPKRANKTLPEPTIGFLVNDVDLVTKACSITVRSDSKKVRVVPRNVPKGKLISTDGQIEVGADAKVPLPTLYMGMTRMLPIGEANPNWVVSQIDKAMDTEDARFISEFLNAVIPGSAARADAITTLSIKGTGKVTKHPKYDHDARCASLGQDSLVSIATALASFHRLKRVDPTNYLGGLLLVDEIDAGLHPHAQRKLMLKLRSVARVLQLQVIATTHSTHIIEEIHPEGAGNANAPDRVVYIVDTHAPRIAGDFTLRQILEDMNLKLPTDEKPPVKVVKVYFEDAEAAFVFERLVSKSFKRKLRSSLNVKLDPVPIGVGCNNLLGLAKRDAYFRRVVTVVDADASITGSAEEKANAVKLPGGSRDGRGLNPESTLHSYLTALVSNRGEHEAAWQDLSTKRLSSDHLLEYLLKPEWSVSNRENAKNWWKNVERLVKDYELVELWAKHHAPKVEVFLNELLAAITIVAMRMDEHAG